MNLWHRTGVAFQRARETRRLNHAALAARCKLAEQELAVIERGEREPSAGEVIKLEDALWLPRGASLRHVRWDERRLVFVVDPPR